MQEDNKEQVVIEISEESEFASLKQKHGSRKQLKRTAKKPVDYYSQMNPATFKKTTNDKNK